MKHALENFKIIDLTRVLGGPYATQILADHGADVIKVEAHIGDEVRGWGPPFSNGMASYFINVNRNKRSIAIDLLSEKSKSSWFWRSPGEKIDPKFQSAYEILSNLPKSENFVVLNFEIDSVDLLKLEQPVHKRYLWEKSKKWEKVEINP